MSRMTAWSIMIVGALAIAWFGYAQKSEPIPPDMMGRPGTIVGFVRDNTRLLREPRDDAGCEGSHPEDAEVAVSQSYRNPVAGGTDSRSQM
jgi:hypothetical protein